MSWPYKDIEQTEYEEVMSFVEKTISEYGGTFITVTEENDAWYSSSGMEVKELVRQNVYRFRDEFVRVDKMYYPDKPFIVLEFSDCLEGPYEDADPFPYDMTADEIEEEIKQTMLIEPYPDWQERAIRERWMPNTGNLMIWRNRYAIYNEWEAAYLVDVDTKEKISQGSYYGDPEIALLDAAEKVAVIVGSDSIGIYDIEKGEFKSIKINISEWIKSLDISGRTIRVICEEGKVYEFFV